MSSDKKAVLMGLAKQVVRRRGIAARIAASQADIEKAKAEEAAIDEALSTALGDGDMAMAAVEVIADTLPQEQDGVSGARVSKAVLLRREKRGEAYARINALSRRMVPGKEDRVGYLEALTDFIFPEGMKARLSDSSEGVIQNRAWIALNGLLHVAVTRCYDCMSEDGTSLFDDGFSDLFPKEWSKEISLGALADWFVPTVAGLEKGDGARGEGGLVPWLVSFSEAVSDEDGDRLNACAIGYEVFADFDETSVNDTAAVVAVMSDVLAVLSDSDAPKSAAGGDGSRRRGRKSKAEKEAEAAAAEAAAAAGGAPEDGGSDAPQTVVAPAEGESVSGGEPSED